MTIKEWRRKIIFYALAEVFDIKKEKEFTQKGLDLTVDQCTFARQIHCLD